MSELDETGRRRPSGWDRRGVNARKTPPATGPSRGRGATGRRQESARWRSDGTTAVATPFGSAPVRQGVRTAPAIERRTRSDDGRIATAIPSWTVRGQRFRGPNTPVTVQ